MVLTEGIVTMRFANLCREIQIVQLWELTLFYLEFLSLSWNFAQVFLWWRVVRWLQLKVSELNRWDAGMNRWWSLWLADLMSHVSQTVILTNRQRLVMANEIMVIRIARNAVLMMTMAIALNRMWNIQTVGLEMNYYSEMVVLMRCDNIQ